MNKNESRIRRARKTRIRIALARATRLVVSRSNCHIYAQIIAPEGQSRARERVDGRSRAAQGAQERRQQGAAALVGKRIGDRAKALGIETVAFDRSGYRYHGRVQALAEAAREAGLKF
jgi:large subunit ribosomal protein L18